MKLITLTTTELKNLEKQYEFPKDQAECIFLKGIQAELIERRMGLAGGSLAQLLEDTKKELKETEDRRADLVDGNHAYSKKVFEMERKIEKLEAALKEKEVVSK